MKPTMKYSSFFIFLVISNALFSQNKSFVYDLHYKKIASVDSLTKEKFVLDINDNKSMFRKISDKTGDSISHSTKRFSFMTTSFKDYNAVSKDFKSGMIQKYIINFQKVFTISIEEDLLWKIDDETKVFAELKCQKATTNYGGRNWVAWFSNEIPLQEGPYVFHGLPGLIIEIHDEKLDYRFSLVQIRNANGKLYEKEKGVKISWAQYEKLANDYYADPTREINSKNSGNADRMIRWQDENGNEFIPNFKEMNEREQKEIRTHNNPIELNHKIIYK